MSHPLCYTRRMKNMRNKIPTTETSLEIVRADFFAAMKRYKIPTTTEMNLAAVKLCATLPKAEILFRLLEHANDRGTTMTQFDELQDHFDKKEFPW